MKNNFTLLLIGILLFTSTLYGCDQKEVGNITVTPQPPVTNTASKT